MRPFSVRGFFDTDRAIVDNRPVAAFHVEQGVVQAVGDCAETENALDGAGGRGDVHFARRVLHLRLSVCIHLYMYYFYVLKERERLTCVRVDWVYSCDVSSLERKKKRRKTIRVRNPKILR